MRLKSLCLATVASFCLAPAMTRAQPAIDDDATVVHLRVDCSLPGSTYLDNCFEDTDDLTDWLWDGGRNSAPSSSDRVFVQVGPGDFDPIRCANDGYVSFVGSGREHTRFVHTNSHANNAAIDTSDCDGLSFANLAAVSIRDDTAAGVWWRGTGNGTWLGVDAIGQGTDPNAAVYGWYDTGSSSDTIVQYIFDSRIMAEGEGTLFIGYDAGASEVWFYGGQISVQPSGSGSILAAIGVFAPSPTTAGTDTSFFVFGTSIRVLGANYSGTVTGRGSGLVGGLRGVYLSQGSTFHMHGGIINVTGTGPSGNVDVEGIGTSDANDFAHTPGTSFVIKAGGSGTARRLNVGAGTVQSPYVWPASSTAPTALSQHGSDAFVDTAAGSGSDEAHLMIYDTTCASGGGPWRDMVDGACR